MVELKELKHDPLLRTSDPMEEWRYKPVKCMYCGIQLKNDFARKGHMSHCSKRLLRRYFLVGKYVFIVALNPLRRTINSINKVIEETHDAKIVMGALRGFMAQGTVNTFTAIELKDKLKIKDGMVFYNNLCKNIEYEDFRQFKKELAEFTVII